MKDKETRPVHTNRDNTPTYTYIQNIQDIHRYIHACRHIYAWDVSLHACSGDVDFVDGLCDFRD